MQTSYSKRDLGLFNVDALPPQHTEIRERVTIRLYSSEQSLASPTLPAETIQISLDSPEPLSLDRYFVFTKTDLTPTP